MTFIAFIFTSLWSDVFTCWESYGFFYEGPVLKPFNLLFCHYDPTSGHLTLLWINLLLLKITSSNSLDQ